MPLDIESKEEIELCFKTVDWEKTGTISITVLKLILDHIGYNIGDDNKFKEITFKYQDNYEKITLNNIYQMLEDNNLVKNEESTIGKIFNLLDSNHHGKVGKQQLLLLSNELNLDFNDEDINNMIKVADLNDDGMIDLFEFSKLLERIHKFQKETIS